MPSSSWGSSATRPDADFLDTVPNSVILRFRDTVFSQSFIAENARMFLDNKWINRDHLEDFMVNNGRCNLSRSSSVSSDTRGRSAERAHRFISPQLVPNALINDEHHGFSTRSSSRASTSTSTSSTNPIRRANQGSSPSLGRATDGMMPLKRSRAQVKEEYDEAAMLWSSPEPARKPVRMKRETNEEGEEIFSLLSSDSESESELLAKEEQMVSIWLDPEVSSYRINKPFALTIRTKVNFVEVVRGLPRAWPVVREPSAFLVDLSDKRYEFYDDDGKLYSVDALIKNQDQDAWEGCSGNGSKTLKIDWPNEDGSTTPVLCRRSRLTCKGAYACSEVDQSLVNISRHELDPSVMQAVAEQLLECRAEQGSSSDHHVVSFWRVVHDKWKCPSTDSEGEPCSGKPKIRTFSAGPVKGKDTFVGCSQWAPGGAVSHGFMAIPENVDEREFTKIFNGGKLNGGGDTRACARIVPRRNGGNMKTCKFVHMRDGEPVTGTMQMIKCNATRRIYVPLDETIRKALVLHNHVAPHSHPTPQLTKATFEVKRMFNECIDAAGPFGCTVAKLERASSTALILGGKTPSAFHGSLGNVRLKRDLLKAAKNKKAPGGLGESGLWGRYLEDSKLPMESRYIQSVSGNVDGNLTVFTALHGLLQLIFDASTRFLEIDTTFKRTDGRLNEWEISILYKPLNQAIVVCRVYTSSATREHYKYLFDELQAMVLKVTGKALRFKRLTPGGNIIAIIVDLEVPQIQGAGDSFLPTNVPSHSGVDTNDPDEIIPEMVRACSVHVLRAIREFKDLVSADRYQQLKRFPYLRSKNELDEFGRLVEEIGLKKITDWWNHKLTYSWMTKVIVRGLSPLTDEELDIIPSNTNLSEGMHHTTNLNTGTKQPIVEAIETARAYDTRVLEGIKESRASGVLRNAHTDLYDRQVRSVQRTSSSMRKSKEASKVKAKTTEILEQIKREKDTRKESLQRQKDLQAALPVPRSQATRRQRGKLTELAVGLGDSAGRVKSSGSSTQLCASQAGPSTSQYNIIPSIEQPALDVEPEFVFPSPSLPSSSTLSCQVADYEPEFSFPTPSFYTPPHSFSSTQSHLPLLLPRCSTFPAPPSSAPLDEFPDLLDGITLY